MFCLGRVEKSGAEGSRGAAASRSGPVPTRCKALHRTKSRGFQLNIQLTTRVWRPSLSASLADCCPCWLLAAGGRRAAAAGAGRARCGRWVLQGRAAAAGAGHGRRSYRVGAGGRAAEPGRHAGPSRRRRGGRGGGRGRRRGFHDTAGRSAARGGQGLRAAGAMRGRGRWAKALMQARTCCCLLRPALEPLATSPPARPPARRPCRPRRSRAGCPRAAASVGCPMLRCTRRWRSAPRAAWRACSWGRRWVVAAAHAI